MTDERRDAPRVPAMVTSGGKESGAVSHSSKSSEPGEPLDNMPCIASPAAAAPEGSCYLPDETRPADYYEPFSPTPNTAHAALANWWRHYAKNTPYASDTCELIDHAIKTADALEEQAVKMPSISPKEHVQSERNGG